jgi:hypothetical protein
MGDQNLSITGFFSSNLLLDNCPASNHENIMNLSCYPSCKLSVLAKPFMQPPKVMGAEKVGSCGSMVNKSIVKKTPRLKSGGT